MRSSILVSTAGGDTGQLTVETEVSPDRIIEPLRPVSTLLRSGAQVVNVTNGNNFAIPRFSVPGAASSGETTTASIGTVTVEILNLVANYYKTECIVSNQLIAQSKYSPGILEVLKGMLVKNAAILLDKMALVGTGATGQETSIFNVANNTLPAIDPAKTSQVITPSAAWTFANAQTAAYNLDQANINPNRSWIVSPATATKLRQAYIVGSTFPRFILESDGKMAGYPVLVSNQLASSPVANYGALLDGSEAIFALFGGGAFIEVNPFKYATQFATSVTVGLLGAFGFQNWTAVCPVNASMAQ